MTDAPISGLAEAALSTVAGQREAERLLLTLHDGCAPADLLTEALAQVQACGDQHMLRGFLREIQKQLERAAG